MPIWGASKRERTWSCKKLLLSMRINFLPGSRMGHAPAGEVDAPSRHLLQFEA